jgi:predicted anti-sigma-YlaC factor YlaD
MQFFISVITAPQGPLREVVMNCRDTIHLICWYLEGKLAPTVSKDIEDHLHGCSNCQLVLKAATSTLDHYFEPVKELGTSAEIHAV